MAKDDGGPAFPRPFSRDDAGDFPVAIDGHAGMSLLDFFAAHAPEEPDWHRVLNSKDPG